MFRMMLLIKIDVSLSNLALSTTLIVDITTKNKKLKAQIW